MNAKNSKIQSCVSEHVRMFLEVTLALAQEDTVLVQTSEVAKVGIFTSFT